MLLEDGPFLGGDQLDALAAKLVGRSTHFLGVPVLGETPGHNGLVDATFLDPDCLGFAFLDVGRSGMSGSCGGEAGGDKPGGSLEDSSATEAARSFMRGGQVGWGFHEQRFKSKSSKSKCERDFSKGRKILDKR